MIVAD